MKLQYRPEIDGIRGVAIILVVAFHFNLDFLLGGYIGVDIFFVISGYLITSIIISELKAGLFSVTDFYERRLRRLGPAFALMLIVSLPLAYFTLMPTMLIEYMNSVIYALVFFSNYFFYNSEIEYGLEEGIYHPLLHSWSLSIEWQFYILFPIILISLYKYSKKFAFVLLLIIFFISITLSIFYSSNNSLVFYMIQFRVWELVIGSMISIYRFDYTKKIKTSVFTELFNLMSFLLIVFSLYLGYKNIPYPLNVLPAIIGTATLIIFCSQNDMIGKMLSTKLFVFIGLISYSLYIWHFPIIAFDTIIESEIDKIILFISSIGISIISYKFIEVPFRNSKITSKKVFIVIFSMSIGIILIFFAAVNLNDGFKKRFYIENINLDNFAYPIERDELVKSFGPPNYSSFKNIEKENILVIGNSFGQDLFYSLKINESLFVDYEFSFIRTEIYCLKNFLVTDQFCDKKLQNREINKISKADIVLISTRWKEKDLEFISDIIINLKAQNKKIVLVSPAPEFDIYWKYAGSKIYGVVTMLDEYLLKHRKIPNENDKLMLEQRYYSYNKKDKKYQKNFTFLKSIAEKNGIKFLDQKLFYCDDKSETCDVITDDEEKIFYDYGHRTYAGNKFMGRKMFNQDLINF